MASPLAHVTTVLPSRTESAMRLLPPLSHSAGAYTPGLLTAAAHALRNPISTVAESPFYAKYTMDDGPPLATGVLR